MKMIFKMIICFFIGFCLAKTARIYADPGIMIDVDIFIEQPGGYDPGGLVCK